MRNYFKYIKFLEEYEYNFVTKTPLTKGALKETSWSGLTFDELTERFQFSAKPSERQILLAECKLDLLELNFIYPEKTNEVFEMITAHRKKFSSGFVNINLYFLLDWMNKELKSIEKEPKINPFKDEQTKNVFKYLESCWHYDKEQRFTYIYEFLVDNGFHTKLTTKSDYHRYVREKYNFKGNFQYDKTTSKKRFQELEELYKEYKVQLELN